MPAPELIKRGLLTRTPSLVVFRRSKRAVNDKVVPHVCVVVPAAASELSHLSALHNYPNSLHTHIHNLSAQDNAQYKT